MPELPEVETVRLQLLSKIRGKTFKSVTIYHPKTVNYDDRFALKLRGKVVKHIDRIGKLLIFSFRDESDLFLLAHLKMTGQFFLVDKTEITGGGHSPTTKSMEKLPNKHTRVGFVFTDNTKLFFNDMRLFGFTKLVDSAAVELAKAKFGPEPLAPDFNAKDLYQTLQKRRTAIKAALLNQSLIAGLGNIYVDEVLFRSGIRPTRRADHLTKREVGLLVKHSREILEKAISVGGTTFQHFLDTGGENGNYKDYLLVFGKENTPCPKCGTIIKKIRCAGRGTHFCPHCQT